MLMKVVYLKAGLTGCILLKAEVPHNIKSAKDMIGSGD
jgi:hypothetical protein